MLVPLGIEKGKPFNPTEQQKKVLTEAAQLGELMARANAYDKRFANATVWPGKKWEYANMVRKSLGEVPRAVGGQQEGGLSRPPLKALAFKGTRAVSGPQAGRGARLRSL